MPVDSFQSTAYQIGRIVRALTADADGNLIFRDIPNPDGVTLTQLINGLIAANITVDTDGTFYTGITNVQDALTYLNQFAYLKYTSRFIYVDPTIPDSLISDGEIYNRLSDAVDYAKTLLHNGFNTTNIMVMGCHRPTAAESLEDVGVYEFDGSSTIEIDVNGLNIIGVGNPIFRVQDSDGTSTRKNIFLIKENSINKVSVSFQDISFEFNNSKYTTFIKVKSAPQSGATIKEHQGVRISNCSVSFAGGSNDNNRLLEINDVITSEISNIMVDGLRLGTINGVSPSTNEIQLVYMNHNPKSVLTVSGLTMANAQLPNPEDNTQTNQITALTCIHALRGQVIICDPVLDEKAFWTGNLSTGVVTKLLYADSADTKVSIFNPSIVRNNYNTQNEDSTGTTILNDWMLIENSAKVNAIGGVDERFDIDVQSIPTSSTGTTGTSGTNNYIVKPVKSFWNGENIAFGIGHRNELRLGKPTQSDIDNYLTRYDTTTYGFPFWISPTGNLQYFDGTIVHTVGGGGGSGTSTGYSTIVLSTDWVATSYTIDSVTYSGYEYTITHSLNLISPQAITYTIFDTDDNIEIQAQQVFPQSINATKFILGTARNVRITISGLVSA
jgi:hypothetical protein